VTPFTGSKRVTGDIWDYLPTHAIVVPVNMQGVCGRGIARQMRDQWPWIEDQLKADRPDPSMGSRFSKDGIGVFPLFDLSTASDYKAGMTRTAVITFPVKANWRDKASPDLIRESARQLNTYIGVSYPEDRFVMPLVGCGFGELTEAEVMPILGDELADVADRILIVEPDAACLKKYAASFKPGVRHDRRTDAPR